MNRKNILSLIISLVIAFFIANESFAVAPIPQKDANITVSVNADDESDIDSEETDIIKRISIKNKFKRSPESQINSFFKKYNRYISKNQVEKLKELYSDDYVNSDGFDKETVFKMMEMASASYKDVSYSTDIQSIVVDGNNAVVKVHEVAVGETLKKVDKVDDTGSITSEIYYTDYLKKEGNKWKISASVVTFEKVELKYGEAKKMTVDICAPEMVKAGSEYEISVNTTTPDGVFVVGSIVNEQIVYPQVSTKDVFRSIKSGELARVVKANKENNEYATISVAITRAQVQPPSVVLNMTGMAFVMKRVNVLNVKNNINIEKGATNAKTSAK